MKKKTVILLAVLILAAVCLFNSVYTVEENEYGCTVRLSKIISTTDEPGLHFKVPFLDSVKSPNLNGSLGISEVTTVPLF